MTVNILNCENSLTALNSLARILGVLPEVFLENMRLLEFSCNEQADFVEERLANLFLKDLKDFAFEVVWFHGTRLEKNHTIHSEGLLPTCMMRERMYNQLYSLSDGIEYVGKNPFYASCASKPNHEGPFGVLFRDVAANPTGSNGFYIEKPELVEDIAGEILGANQEKLVQKYKSMTCPCIIHFIEKPNGNVLIKALRFVYETQIEERDAIESANSCVTCFDGSGILIPPEKITRIEVLNNPNECQ